MIQCSVEELFLTKVLPWGRARLYQLVKNKPQIFEQYGCRVINLQSRFIIETDNPVIESRVIRIRQLLKPRRQKSKTKKISLAMSAPQKILFENLEPLFIQFLNNLDNIEEMPIFKKTKQIIYLSEKHYDTIRTLSKKYQRPMTKIVEILIEFFLLNFSATINKNLEVL